MVEQSPNRPRLRVLLALAVLTVVALSGVVPFTASAAATAQAGKNHTGWYDIVRETVAVVMDSGWVAKVGRAPATGAPGRAVDQDLSSWPAKHR